MIEQIVNSKKIKAGIIGGAGYTGGEMLRILVNHPNVEIAFVNSTSNAGNLISDVHTDLIGDTDLKFTSDIPQDIDVLFLCVGHGDAKKFLAVNPINENIKIIDLSQDFRLIANAKLENRDFVYGLPELNRDAIKNAKNIANPGCFATCIQLGLDLSLEEAQNIYEDYYSAHPFTHVSRKNIDLKQVVNTNKALVHIEKHGNKLFIISAIDNLLKGASGQAVQNMNLMFGLEENSGLRLKAANF
ncbi:MAG: hypothetical protein EOO91_16490 [Pedobacter sp.]|nr:MAG: hypothetical protein EOO91_16490 [Pedobacter sp.]